MVRRACILLIGVACLCGSTGQAAETGSIVHGVDPDLSAGADALELRDYEGAIRLTLAGLNEALRPRDRIGALSNLCGGYVGTGEYEEALRYCNRALRLDSSNWHAYNNRGLANLGLGRYGEARHDVEKGLALNPTSSELRQVDVLVAKAAKPPEKAPVAVSGSRKGTSPPDGNRPPNGD
jgi:tetratricopeptide (TPR) repeat protein